MGGHNVGQGYRPRFDQVSGMVSECGPGIQGEVEDGTPDLVHAQLPIYPTTKFSQTSFTMSTC